MDVIADIRRRHLVSKESISAIARDLNLSRPTVSKHCRSQCEPLYHRHKQSTPMLGAFQSTLESWLTIERHLPKAQRRTPPLQTPETAAEIPLTNWKLLDAVPWKLFNAD